MPDDNRDGGIRGLWNRLTGKQSIGTNPAASVEAEAIKNMTPSEPSPMHNMQGAQFQPLATSQQTQEVARKALANLQDQLLPKAPQAGAWVEKAPKKSDNEQGGTQSIGGRSL